MTNLDPNRAASIDLTLAGKQVTRAQGQTLVAPRFDSVNSFEAPAVVVPKPYAARFAVTFLPATLAPASVTVIGLE